MPNTAQTAETGDVRTSAKEGRFPNYAGRSDCDDEIAAELEAAGIEVHRPEFVRDQGEVKTSVRGSLTGWSFSRAWYYWVAQGNGIELAAADRLYAKHPATVRVEGHCGCPSPREWCKGLAVGSYHVDSPEGLKALADTIRELTDPAASPTPRAPAEPGLPEEVRNVLIDVEETLRFGEYVPFIDPLYGEEVERLGRRIGFGALMTTASASWAKVAAERGDPPGGQFVASPCHGTLLAILARVRSTLVAAPAALPADDGPMPGLAECDRPDSPFNPNNPVGADGGTEGRSCTCHPDDNPPVPCARRYALSECCAAALSTSTPAGAAGDPAAQGEPVAWGYDFLVDPRKGEWAFRVLCHRPVETLSRRNIRPLYEAIATRPASPAPAASAGEEGAPLTSTDAVAHWEIEQKLAPPTPPKAALPHEWKDLLREVLRIRAADCLTRDEREGIVKEFAALAPAARPDPAGEGTPASAGEGDLRKAATAAVRCWGASSPKFSLSMIDKMHDLRAALARPAAPAVDVPAERERIARVLCAFVQHTDRTRVRHGGRGFDAIDWSRREEVIDAILASRPTDPGGSEQGAAPSKLADTVWRIVGSGANTKWAYFTWFRPSDGKMKNYENFNTSKGVFAFNPNTGTNVAWDLCEDAQRKAPTASPASNDMERAV